MAKAKAKSSSTAAKAGTGRGSDGSGRPRLDARPDTLDFRDLMYVPTLHEVPLRIPLADYRKSGVPILDQGKEGACTGFGLAAVVHYLLRTRKVVPDEAAVSPRMLYEMARRYDEWPGTDYEGSSARGAMKGWHKHGVCSEKAWPYDPAAPDTALTGERSCDAASRPLGAYFRVNHKDLVAMHAALAEVGALYATASVHEGWWDPPADGVIPFTKKLTGGQGVDVIYDPVGGALFEEAFRSIAWNGRFLVVGFAAGGGIPALPANLPLLKGASLVGVFWGSFAQRQPQDNAENFQQLFAWHAEGKLKPLVSQSFPLARGGEAIDALGQRKAVGKVVVQVR